MRLNNDFLNEPEYVFGLNNVIEKVIKQYSKEINSNDPPNQEPAPHPFLISNTLLHDVLLLESRSYTLKYAANQKERMLRRTKELNRRIDKKSDSVDPEDMEMVNLVKQEVQDLDDEREMSIARKSFVKMQLEGEKLTRFFCKMNRKYLAKAQFEEVHLEEVDEKGKETIKVKREQESIEK